MIVDLLKKKVQRIGEENAPDISLVFRLQDIQYENSILIRLSPKESVVILPLSETKKTLPSFLLLSIRSQITGIISINFAFAADNVNFITKNISHRKSKSQLIAFPATSSL